MKTNIVVFGKFHAHHLALELARVDNLEKVYTTYPKSRFSKAPELKYKITSYFIFEVLNRIQRKLINSNRIEQVLKNLFAHLVSFKIEINSVIIAWSTTALPLIKSKKKFKIFLERASCHYADQIKLLNKAYNDNNLNFKANTIAYKQELIEYKNCYKIVVPSLFAYNSFSNNGIDKHKLEINQLGCDLRSFYPSKKTKNSDKFIILSVGLASIQKGTWDLIKVINKLSTKYNVKLIHVGNIQKNEFKIFRKKINLSNVEFINSVKENELIKFYRQADLFVLNSIQDGFGMVLLQAYASGVPIISTYNTGFKDILEKDQNAGIIIKPFSKKELKKAVLSYIYQTKTKTNSKKETLSFFDWENYRNRYLKILND